jgi:hypothetical protein
MEIIGAGLPPQQRAALMATYLNDPRTFGEFAIRAFAPAKPPEIAEFYDEKTGRPYKAQWDGKDWQRIGGLKAETDKGGSLTPAQQANNSEIKIARDTLRAKYPGLTPEQLRERTAPTPAARANR